MAHFAGNADGILASGGFGYRSIQNSTFNLPVEGDLDSVFEFGDAQFPVLDGYGLRNGEALAVVPAFESREFGLLLEKLGIGRVQVCQRGL